MVTFEEICNHVLNNMNKFLISEKKDYSKLSKYRDEIEDKLNEIIDETIEKFYNNDIDTSKFGDKEELKNELKSWFIKMFEIKNDKDLEKFYIETIKKGIKYVEKDIYPEYLTILLINIYNKLKNYMNYDCMYIFDDIIKRLILLYLSSYMYFETAVLEKIGINKSLKYNTIKTFIKKMNI